MKKIFVATFCAALVFMGIFIVKAKYISPAAAKENIYTLSKNHSTQAQNIVYNELKKESRINIDELNKDDIHAFFYDLNDDGQDEVLAIIASDDFIKKYKRGFMIYEKFGKNYKRIDNIFFLTNECSLEILDKKTENYRDLKVLPPNNFPLDIKMNKDIKKYDFYIEGIEDITAE